MQFRQYLRFLLFGNNYSIQPVLQKLIFFTIFLLVILWIVFAFYFKGSFCYSAFTITAVIGAYYFGGSAIGFIFAIPKSFQGKQTIATNETNGDVTYHFRDNTSLEEISDWITKIIIGLSLTQFNKIQDMLYQAARYISSALSDAAICSNGFCTIDFLPFSYGIILLYGLLGIMSGYLWTRIEFPKILIRRDKDMIRIQHEAFQNKVNDPNNELFGSIGLKTTEFATDGKKEIMERILGKVKPGPQADDPQKNRWGGKAEKNGRRVSATVTTSLVPDFHTVRITVTSTNNTPLGEVGIVLHPSFNPILRVLNAGEATEAYTEVLAYEAFTLGVLCDVASEDNYTDLELDLNTVAGYPKDFYWH